MPWPVADALPEEVAVLLRKTSAGLLSKGRGMRLWILTGGSCFRVVATIECQTSWKFEYISVAPAPNQPPIETSRIEQSSLNCPLSVQQQD